MKTFQDIWDKRMHDPVIHHGLTLYQRGDVTMEQALIEMVLVLAEQKKELEESYSKHLQQCSTSSIFLRP